MSVNSTIFICEDHFDLDVIKEHAVKQESIDSDEMSTESEMETLFGWLEEGFVEGTSDNLPKMDVLTVSDYLVRIQKLLLVGTEIEKSERKKYGDNAVGRVQVKREGHVCIVKGTITPMPMHTYNCSLECNEREEIVLNASCGSCTSRKGCVHILAFLFWLHRRSEEQSKSITECYWRV